MKVFKNLLFLLLIFWSAALAQESGGARGKVRTNKGDAIAGATVTARQKGEDVKSVKTDSRGVFTLEGLKSGIYNIVFEKNGYSTSVKYNVEIQSGSINDLGEKLVLNIDPGTQVIVKGSVFDKNGVSIYGAKIQIQKINADGSTKKVGSGVTSEMGEFTFRFPEASAKFRITASAKGSKITKEVEVESAAIYRVAFMLDMEVKR